MVGREWAIKQVMANLKRKQNTLILGPSGIGKTTLLWQIAGELGAGAYYIEALSPPRSAMLSAYQTIGDFNDDDLKEMKVGRWTLTEIAKELVVLVGEKAFVLEIDSLDKVTSASSEWLKVLAESPIAILGACREVREGKLLDRFFWTFETLTLHPMSDVEIKEIIRSEVYPSETGDPAIRFRDGQAQQFFVERTIRAAKGVPLTAVEMCKRAKGVGAVSVTFVREHLMVDHEASLKWVDATPLLLLAICGFAMMRYLARGMGSQDAYVFFGALYALIMVVRMFIMRGRKRRS
jgi:replication-associated recombination protein RarA